jgi:hypothetical protein
MRDDHDLQSALRRVEDATRRAEAVKNLADRNLKRAEQAEARLDEAINLAAKLAARAENAEALLRSREHLPDL